MQALFESKRLLKTYVVDMTQAGRMLADSASSRSLDTLRIRPPDDGEDDGREPEQARVP